MIHFEITDSVYHSLLLLFKRYVQIHLTTFVKNIKILKDYFIFYLSLLNHVEVALTMFLFLLGMFIGCLLGITILSCLAIAKYDDMSSGRN